jgi:hypothetical protein
VCAWDFIKTTYWHGPTLPSNIEISRSYPDAATPKPKVAREDNYNTGMITFCTSTQQFWATWRGELGHPWPIDWGRFIYRGTPIEVDASWLYNVIKGLCINLASPRLGLKIK